MNLEHGFDAITEDALRQAGSKKWSAYPDTISAFVAEMDFGTAPPVSTVLQEMSDAARLGYIPSTTVEAMSQACSTWLDESYKWQVPASDIRPVPDVLTGLVMAITHYSAPGSAVVLPTPAHMPFLKLPATLGREIIQVPMIDDGHDWKLDLDGLDAAFKSGGGLLVFCNPHNPIGKVYSSEEMHDVAAVVERNGARVYSDEIHAPIVFAGNRHIPYASVSTVAAAHTVTLTSATKAWNMSGLKCAQMIFTNDADRQKWDEVNFMAEHGVGHLGVVASTAAFREGRPWLNDVLAYLDDNRRQLAGLLAEHLPRVRYRPPEGSYLAWLDCRYLGLGDHPSEFFLEHAAVACSDGALFGDNASGHIRFNLAMPSPILKQAVENMGDALRRRPGSAPEPDAGARPTVNAESA
ncbi:MalY/PatB family protein [Arthrobacter castelli]|uniref:MalY/PatB family protein n=1 Tax=Arthrobacter castelli TaxID=271431 RepID=UPI0004030FA0|nr:aminotransferase class I/II-fold pyridoxal phosphate-dependent enzyme [Arthrobacter castelli]